jgi:hypothetical protein
MGLKSVGGRQKTGEQILAVILTQVLSHGMAGINLCPDKVKKSVIHVKQ